MYVVILLANKAIIYRSVLLANAMAITPYV